MPPPERERRQDRSGRVIERRVPDHEGYDFYAERSDGSPDPHDVHALYVDNLDEGTGGADADVELDVEPLVERDADDRASLSGRRSAERRPGRTRTARTREPVHVPAGGPVVDEEGGSPSARRWAFAAGCLLGIVVGWAIFGTLLTRGFQDLVPRAEYGSGFYELQARAILDGHFDVPNGSLGIEGFEIDGKTYTYFGLVPALARIPVLLLTDTLDGRLNVLSILLAGMVGSIFAAMLLWRVRRFVRGNAPVSTVEVLAVALGLAVYTGGSVLVMLATRPVIYHEDISWGVALTLGSLWAVIGVMSHLTLRRVVAAGVLAILAMNTRASLGLVATMALGFVTLAVGFQWFSAWRRSHRSGPLFGRERMSFGLLVALALATALPVATYAAVGMAKFGTPVGIRMETQVFSRLDEHRMEMLRANDGAFFRPAFVPTTALTYLRPDGIRLAREYPYFFVPSDAPDPAGDVVFDRVDPTPSLLPTMPFWVLLAGWGLFTVFRPSPRCRATVKRLRAPVIGAAAGSLGVLLIGFIAPRYLGDFLPFVLLAGAAGLHDLVPRLEGRGRAVRVAGLSLLAAGAALSILVNVGLGITARGVGGTRADLHDYLDARQRMSEIAGDSPSTHLQRGDALPRRGGPDELFALGDCDALYWSTGAEPQALAINNWRPVERAEAGGEHHVSIRFDPQAPGARSPLLGISDPQVPSVMYVEWLSRTRVRFGFLGSGRENQSEPIDIDPDRTYDVSLVADRHTAEMSVILDGSLVFETLSLANGPHLVGRNPRPASVDAAFSGTITPQRNDTPLCNRLVDEAGG